MPLESKLKIVYDNLDTVPEALRDLYEEDLATKKFRITQIEDLKSKEDVDRLTGALTHEKTNHKTTKEKLALWADLNADEVKGKLARFDELEAAASGKIPEDKLESIVTARLKAKLAPLETESARAKADLVVAQSKIAQFEQLERTRRIHDVVRQAAVAAKVVDPAIEDVLFLAERLFEVDEEGNVVTRDNVGVTPQIDPTVWLSDMPAKRPHWWPVSQGGGARGNGSGNGFGGSNPFQKQGFNLTNAMRAYKENPVRAKQMADAAGFDLVRMQHKA